MSDRHAKLRQLCELLAYRDSLDHELNSEERHKEVRRRLLAAYDAALESWRDLSDPEGEALLHAHWLGDPRSDRLTAAASLARMRELHELHTVRGVLALAEGLRALPIDSLPRDDDKLHAALRRAEALWPAYYELSLAARYDGRGELQSRADSPLDRIVRSIWAELPALKRSRASGAPENIATRIVAEAGIATKVVGGEVQPAGERTLRRWKAKWAGRARERA